MLLFIPVAAAIRLAGFFVVIFITAVLIMPLLVVEKPGGKTFDIDTGIGLDPSPIVG